MFRVVSRALLGFLVNAIVYARVVSRCSEWFLECFHGVVRLSP